MSEKVINKIRKLLALAEGNSSYKEAESAALKAQALMSKYNIDLIELDLEENSEKIGIYYENINSQRSWKYKLATVIADNFRCKTFVIGTKKFGFYGRDLDAEIAKEVFSFLFKKGHKLANKIVSERKKEGDSVEGIYNSYVLGYVTGINAKLEEQSTKLALVISKEVEEEFKSYSMQENMGTKKSPSLIKNDVDYIAYKNGLVDGRYAMQSRELNNP
ncbi:TPA: DUF2786 domain-containing protein [Clostridioides difficile]